MKKALYALGIIIIGLLMISFPTNAEKGSSLTKETNFLFLVGMAVATLLGLFVLGLLVYMLFKYHEAKNVPRKRIKNEMRWEITWTLIAILLVSFAFALTVPTIQKIVTEPESYETLTIVGHKFYWEFHLEPGSQAAIANNRSDFLVFPRGGTLKLIVGQTYLINITGADVIHSFYVPDLTLKIDAVPGQYNQFWFKITEAGTYKFTCAEYCGISHYNMYGYIQAINV